jgi:hypothetical protein
MRAGSRASLVRTWYFLSTFLADTSSFHQSRLGQTQGKLRTSTVFAGCISWPSFESVSPYMPPDEWSLSSSVARSRNWNPSSVIVAMFGYPATKELSQVRNVPCLRHSIYVVPLKMMIASTNRRLGTNTRTSCGTCFVSAGWRACVQAAAVHEPDRAGKEKRLFAPFIYNNDQFTKTGSGQT